MKKANAKLFLLGDGPKRKEMEAKAGELGIDKDVIFAGNKNPVAPYYQSFDAFLFPSRFEGMPGTVVEAQAAGLPCLISDSITTQVKVTELVQFLSLEKSDSCWADVFLKQIEDSKECIKEGGSTLIDTFYDVTYQVKCYEQFYLTGDITKLKK